MRTHLHKLLVTYIILSTYRYHLAQKVLHIYIQIHIFKLTFKIQDQQKYNTFQWHQAKIYIYLPYDFRFFPSPIILSHVGILHRPTYKKCTQLNPKFIYRIYIFSKCSTRQLSTISKLNVGTAFFISFYIFSIINFSHTCLQICLRLLHFLYDV